MRTDKVPSDPIDRKGPARQIRRNGEQGCLGTVVLGWRGRVRRSASGPDTAHHAAPCTGVNKAVRINHLLSRMSYSFDKRGAAQGRGGSFCGAADRPRAGRLRGSPQHVGLGAALGAPLRLTGMEGFRAACLLGSDSAHSPPAVETPAPSPPPPQGDPQPLAGEAGLHPSPHQADTSQAASSVFLMEPCSLPGYCSLESQSSVSSPSGRRSRRGWTEG